MKTSKSLLKLVIIYICCITNLFAQTAKVAIIDFFPFGYTDHNGNATGMFIDMLEIIQTNIGTPLQPVLLPVPRALRAVTSGEIDMLISYKDPIMAPNVKFVGNVGCLSSLLVPNHKIIINGLRDLKNKRVGFITGGYFHKRFSHNYGLIPMQVPSNESMVRMLIRDRLDVIVINSAVLNAYLNDRNPKLELSKDWRNKIGQPHTLETMETHLSISNLSPHIGLAGKLTNAINNAFEQGLFNRVYQKYGAGSSACHNIQNE